MLLLPQYENEEIIRKAATKIVDDKLYTEDVLQELEIKLSAPNWLKKPMRTLLNSAKYYQIQWNIAI